MADKEKTENKKTPEKKKKLDGLSMRYYSTPKGIVLALCDSELLGNIYKETRHPKGQREQEKEEEYVVLDLKSHRHFYEPENKETVASSAVMEFIRNNKIHCVNAVGPRAVSILTSLGIANDEEIVIVGGIPHAIIYYIRLRE